MAFKTKSSLKFFDGASIRRRITRGRKWNTLKIRTFKKFKIPLKKTGRQKLHYITVFYRHTNTHRQICQHRYRQTYWKRTSARGGWQCVRTVLSGLHLFHQISWNISRDAVAHTPTKHLQYIPLQPFHTDTSSLLGCSKIRLKFTKCRGKKHSRRTNLLHEATSNNLMLEEKKWWRAGAGDCEGEISHADTSKNTYCYI